MYVAKTTMYMYAELVIHFIHYSNTLSHGTAYTSEYIGSSLVRVITYRIFSIVTLTQLRQHIVNRTLGNTHNDSFKRDSINFICEIAFKSVVWKPNLVFLGLRVFNNAVATSS